MSNLVFKSIKISIVIPVYNSHRVVRRQIKYFRRLDLPDDIEIIFMDDGSDPPLEFPNHRLRNFNIYPTGNTRPWTQPDAKNLGAKIARGEFLFITDIDHILTKDAIDAVYNFSGDKMRFTRSFAILNNHGEIIKEPEVLFGYGLSRNRYKKRGLHITYHVNTFAMRKRIFEEIDGYHPKCSQIGKHDIYDDNHLYGKYRRYCKAGKCRPEELGPEIHVFPASVQDPKRLFHNLER